MWSSLPRLLCWEVFDADSFFDDLNLKKIEIYGFDKIVLYKTGFRMDLEIVDICG